MPSASARVRASGFSTSTALPSSSACMTGRRCSPSLVATITALTSGREIAARLSPEWNCAPVLRARRIGVGDGDEVDGGMPGGELRAQAPDAPGADHGDPQLPALDHLAIRV